MQESEIIKGCRMPSVIEIMEASLIVEPGTLGKLNRLLDDSRKTGSSVWGSRRNDTQMQLSSLPQI